MALGLDRESLTCTFSRTGQTRAVCFSNECVSTLHCSMLSDVARHLPHDTDAAVDELRQAREHPPRALWGDSFRSFYLCRRARRSLSDAGALKRYSSC